MNLRKEAEEALRTQLREKVGPYFQRRLAYELTGGLIKPKTCANRDAAGTGVPNAFRVNGKVCYFTDDFVSWLFNDGSLED